MNRGHLSEGIIRDRNEAIGVVMKLHESRGHDPVTNHETKQIVVYS